MSTQLRRTVTIRDEEYRMIQDVLLQDIIISDKVAPSSSVVASAIGRPPDTYLIDNCAHATCNFRRRLPNILQKGKNTEP